MKKVSMKKIALTLSIATLALSTAVAHADGAATICGGYASDDAKQQLSADPGNVTLQDFTNVEQFGDDWQIEFYKMDKAPNYLLVESVKVLNNNGTPAVGPCYAHLVYTK